MSQLFLIPVKSPNEKLGKIIWGATSHFERGDPLAFIVENQTSADYIDNLLWNLPKSSFLPHDLGGEELIQILLKPKSDLKFIFNLSLEPLITFTKSVIYEFDDETSPLKRENSKKRYYAYKRAGFKIATI